MNLIKRNAESSHWYEFDGTSWIPRYEIEAANGNLRPVTLRDARVCGFYPSVTNVLSAVAKPQLQSWKEEQCVLAALTLPQLPGEPLEAFAARVLDDAEAQSVKARDLGTRIHAACEAMLRGDPVEPELESWIAGFRDWASAEFVSVLALEKIVGRMEFGYAGRLDLHCELRGLGEAVVDFKTQRVKRDAAGYAKPVFYREWARQLAAYSMAVNRQSNWPALVNVVIDSGTHGPAHVMVWDNPATHWEMFMHAHALWCDEREYYPQQEPTQTEAE